MSIEEIRATLQAVRDMEIFNRRTAILLQEDFIKCVEWLLSEHDSVTAELEAGRAKNAELRESESEGRLVVLPCKVGDTVYEITQGYCDDEDCPDLYHDYVDEVYIDTISWQIWEDGDSEIKINDYLIFGACYPTREEAEAALEGSATDE